MKYAPYSYSKISLFEKCPLAWKFTYIDRVEETKHPSLKLGSIIHEIVATYIKALKERHEVSNHSLLEEIIREHGVNDIEPFIEGIKSIIIPANLNPQVEVELALNKDFEPCEFDSSEAFIRGKIDFTYVIEDTAVIVDWKTNYILPPEEVIDHDIQTRFYALLLFPFLPEKVTRFVVELNYLRHCRIRKTEISRNDLEEVQKWILTNVERIEAEQNFNPTPGDWCSMCGYLHLCPVAKSVVPVAEDSVLDKLPEKITTPDQAVRFAGALKVIDQLRTKIQDLLKEWISENGSIQLSGEVLGFHETETFRWETKEQKAKLAEFFLKAGVPKQQIWDLFSTNKSQVCSFAKKHGLRDRIDEILSTGEKHTYQRFCFRKK